MKQYPLTTPYTGRISCGVVRSPATMPAQFERASMHLNASDELRQIDLQ